MRLLNVARSMAILLFPAFRGRLFPITECQCDALSSRQTGCSGQGPRNKVIADDLLHSESNQLPYIKHHESGDIDSPQYQAMVMLAGVAEPGSTCKPLTHATDVTPVSIALGKEDLLLGMEHCQICMSGQILWVLAELQE